MHSGAHSRRPPGGTPIRVAIDFRCANERGTSNRTYWEGLVRGLLGLEARDTFELILLSNGPSELGQSLSADGSCRYVASKPMSERFWSIVWLPKACRSLGADVVHVQYTISPLMRTPAVTTIHDVSFFVRPEWFSRRDGVLLRRSVPMAARKARQILAVSNHSKQEIVRFTGVDPAKIVVTPIAPQDGIDRVDDREVIGKVLDAHAIRAPYILSVGTLQARKNWKLVLDTYAEAKKTKEDLQLVVTGPCRIDQEELATYARSVGVHAGLILTGSVSAPELSALYSGAVALLHPSFYEGFGLTPLEALRCGCPVVASNNSSIPEIVQQFGTLVDGFDSKVWASEILGAFGSDAASREAAMKFAKTYTWTRTASLTSHAYTEASKP